VFEERGGSFGSIGMTGTICEKTRTILEAVSQTRPSESRTIGIRQRLEDKVSSVGEGLREYWLARGLTIRPGSSEEQLLAFESRYGVRLPPDMRDYFAVVDGLDEGQYDDDFFSFWPLGIVERATTRYLDCFLEDQASYFIFADHSIALPDYAILLTPDGKLDTSVLAVCSDLRQYNTSPVADSFTEFVERYLAGHFARLELSAGIPSRRDSVIAKAPIQARVDTTHPLWDREIDR